MENGWRVLLARTLDVVQGRRSHGANDLESVTNRRMFERRIPDASKCLISLLANETMKPGAFLHSLVTFTAGDRLVHHAIFDMNVESGRQRPAIHAQPAGPVIDESITMWNDPPR